MEVEESWGCRIQARNISSSAIQSGDEDIWEYFPCPFCCVDVEVPFLSNHLQDEHCFDLKNAVCPVCAANPGNDMIAHFIVQHSHLVKRRKSDKTSLWTNSSAEVGKVPYEVSSFFEVASNRRKTHAPDSAPDPLISQFIGSIPFLNTKSVDMNHERDIGPASLHDQRLELCISSDSLEKDYEEKLQKSRFVQEVLMSTIF
ncbi:protein DEHYDRATION-INDUCED 19 homolog 6-like [Typha angustifolia]|uniref:protein DEHYDRATION-INDUCED 19 homolog 6-like n=1 Tax=Typha angustifolia TaxID=59011 RepID=UPI003C2F33CC